MAGRVLLVDDHEPILRALSAYLVDCGFEVDTARDDIEARSMLESTPYAAVVTDLSLRGSQGYEGLQLLRHVRRSAPGVGVILFSAFLTQDVERAAIEAGALAVLHKHAPLQQVAEILRRRIDGVG